MSFAGVVETDSRPGMKTPLTPTMPREVMCTTRRAPNTGRPLCIWSRWMWVMPARSVEMRFCTSWLSGLLTPARAP